MYIVILVNTEMKYFDIWLKIWQKPNLLRQIMTLKIFMPVSTVILNINFIKW